MFADLDKQIATLRQCQIIPEWAVTALCSKAKEILMEEENVHHGACGQGSEADGPPPPTRHR